MADDLAGLSADLRRAGGDIATFTAKAIEVTARNIKGDWSSNAAVSSPEGFVRSYPASIDYEMRPGFKSVSAEIGPNVGKPGGTAGFLEEGTVNRGPQHAGRDALEANEDDFYDGLAKAAVDAILGKS